MSVWILQSKEFKLKTFVKLTIKNLNYLTILKHAVSSYRILYYIFIQNGLNLMLKNDLFFLIIKMLDLFFIIKTFCF